MGFVGRKKKYPLNVFSYLKPWIPPLPAHADRRCVTKRHKTDIGKTCVVQIGLYEATEWYTAAFSFRCFVLKIF